MFSKGNILCSIKVFNCYMILKVLDKIKVTRLKTFAIFDQISGVFFFKLVYCIFDFVELHATKLSRVTFILSKTFRIL